MPTFSLEDARAADLRRCCGTGDFVDVGNDDCAAIAPS